jgi:eukaryotic-like serine/threonine-protein kinase
MESDERRLTDKEAQAVIARAVDMQRRELMPETGDMGLSISDLERVAKESGLDPSYIRRALTEVGAARRGGVAEPLFGGPFILRKSAEVEGSLTDEALSKALASLSDVIGEWGNGTAANGMLTWAGDSAAAMRSGRTLHVALRPSPKGLAVRVEENLSNIAGGLFGGIVGGLGISVGLCVGIPVGLTVLHSPLFAVLVGIGGMALTWLLSRGIYSRIVKWRSRKIEGMIEGIKGLLESLKKG